MLLVAIPARPPPTPPAPAAPKGFVLTRPDAGGAAVAERGGGWENDKGGGVVLAAEAAKGLWLPVSAVAANGFVVAMGLKSTRHCTG